MRYEINGTVLPSVDVWLGAGESVFTESGGMAWMKGDIRAWGASWPASRCS